MSCKFESGDVVIKKDEENRVDTALPESKIEILGVLERIDADETLYMLARGRPINTQKIDRNYKLKKNTE